MNNVFDLIKNNENRLMEAMISSNVRELEFLLADELIFTDHTGAVHSKTDDINAHKSGSVSIDSIELSEQKIAAYENTAVVSVIMAISGIFGGSPASGRFRFTRNWQKFQDSSWRVVSGHSTLLP